METQVFLIKSILEENKKKIIALTTRNRVLTDHNGDNLREIVELKIELQNLIKQSPTFHLEQEEIYKISNQFSIDHTNHDK